MRQTILTVLKLMKELGYEGKISVEEYERGLIKFQEQVDNAKDELELANLLAEWLDSLSMLNGLMESRRDRFSW